MKRDEERECNMSKPSIWNELVLPVIAIISFITAIMTSISYFAIKSINHQRQDKTTFITVADSTLITNEDLSKLHSVFTEPLAGCYMIANDTLSAIAEAINKMRNVQIIHKFTRINDTLYYMELSKLKEPDEN